MALSDIDDLNNNPVLGDYQVTFHGQIHRGMKSLKTLEQTTDSQAAKDSGDQTIAGIKTFSSSPVVPLTPTINTQVVTKGYVDSALSIKENAITSGTTSQYWRGDKTWQTLDKAVAGLSNVDNTSDANKPVSTGLSASLSLKQSSITAGTTSQYWRGDKTWQTLDRTSVGLSNVDNTSDGNKPVSTATQTALNLKQSSISSGELYQYWRGDKSWQTLNGASAGLGNVNNTADVDKPISISGQAALDLKATTANTSILTGNQTVIGVKTFTSSPKLIGSTTVGYVLKSADSSGTVVWQDIGELVTTVDWNNITVETKPTTFPPTIGTGASDAASGNHTHTKSDVGLSNADNTADVDKPVSTATQTSLGAKVSTARTISTSSHFTGGGDLSGDRTLAIATDGIGLSDLDSSSKKLGIIYVQTLDTRAVGLGQIEDGFEFQFPVTITSVKYRMGVADASGTTTCEIRKNGVTVSGSSGTASTSPSAVTGSWSFSAGDVITIYTTAIGTTPGKRLTAEILSIKS